jgi:MFS family permease
MSSPRAHARDVRAPRPASIWRNSWFRMIWAGQTASIFGDRVTGIALPWLLLQQTRSPFDAALISASLYLPLLLLGLPAGLIADRASRRRLMIASDLTRAAALGVVVLAGVARQLPPLWLLVLVVLILGTGQLFFQVAYRVWLPDVTSDEALGRANAALEASDAASTFSGPLLGGALIQAIGPVFALGADALSYLVSALSLGAARRAPQTGKPHMGQQPADAAAVVAPGRSLPMLADEALEGVRLILRSPEQRLLKGISLALYASSGTIELLLATLAQVQLHLPPWQAGVIFGMAGIGGLAASALAPRVSDRGWRRGLAGACALAALASGWLALAGTLGPQAGFLAALIGNLLLDGAVSLAFILTTTQSTLVTPRAARGRVNAVTQIYSALVRGLSLVAAGALSARGSALPAFILLVACFAGAALVARPGPNPLANIQVRRRRVRGDQGRR